MSREIFIAFFNGHMNKFRQLMRLCLKTDEKFGALFMENP
jgi:hypothetical protein